MSSDAPGELFYVTAQYLYPFFSISAAHPDCLAAARVFSWGGWPVCVCVCVSDRRGEEEWGTGACF